MVNLDISRIDGVERNPDRTRVLMRSKRAIRTTAKRHFADPSIATAALGADADKLLSDFQSSGYLFESMCIRDLRIYADALDGSVYHYRDQTGLEVDAKYGQTRNQ